MSDPRPRLLQALLACIFAAGVAAGFVLDALRRWSA